MTQKDQPDSMRTGFYNGFATREEMEAANSRFSREMAQKFAEQDALRDERIQKGVPALKRLADVAEGGSGQCRHVRRFLLSLFNGQKWPLDLTELRGLDSDLQIAVLDVIELDWCGNEVHTYLESGEERFQAWWERESSDQ